MIFCFTFWLLHGFHRSYPIRRRPCLIRGVILLEKVVTEKKWKKNKMVKTAVHKRHCSRSPFLPILSICQIPGLYYTSFWWILVRGLFVNELLGICQGENNVFFFSLGVELGLSFVLELGLGFDKNPITKHRMPHIKSSLYQNTMYATLPHQL